MPELPALPIAYAWTGDDGSFRLEKVPPGNYDLYARGPAAGYGPFEITVLGANPRFGRTRIQVAAQNLEGISVPVSAGRTADVILHGGADGCPKTSEVTFDLLEPWGFVSTAHGVQANFDKPQTAHDLAPARYSVWAAGLGAGCYQANHPVVDLSRDSAGAVAVELGKAGAIRGIVRAADANAKDFAVLLFDTAAAAGSSAQLAFPDEHGRFEFAGLRPGRYRIAAQWAAGGAKVRWVADIAGTMEIDVPSGVPTEVELPVSKGGAR